MKVGPLPNHSLDNTDVVVIKTRDRLSGSIYRVERPFRRNVRVAVRPIVIPEPGTDSPKRRNLDDAILIIYLGDSDISEYPDEGFHVVSVQSGNVIIKLVRHADSHERNDARPIVVRGRVVDPGGKVKVVDHPHRAIDSRGVVHQIVDTDIPVVDPFRPQPVMTWGDVSGRSKTECERIHATHSQKAFQKSFPSRS